MYSIEFKLYYYPEATLYKNSLLHTLSSLLASALKHDMEIIWILYKKNKRSKGKNSKNKTYIEG